MTSLKDRMLQQGVPHPVGKGLEPITIDIPADDFTEDGGPGSGNFGHAGRPNKVGGSAPSGSGGGKTEKKADVGKKAEELRNAAQKISRFGQSGRVRSTIMNMAKELEEKQKNGEEVKIDPDFDVFEYIDQESKKYKEKGPEFQKKVEETISVLEKSGRVKTVAKAAKECGGDTRKFLQLMGNANRLVLEQQHHDIDTEETWPDYIKRIQMTLEAEPKYYAEDPDGMIDGLDISQGYSWGGVPYTDKKFGQVIDTEIEDVIAKQKFNGTPRVIGKDDFDAFLKKNPGMPVMFRTFSAPTKELVDLYNKDLESGAWYIDCSVGGAKYGQGMYTAFAPQPHVIPYDSKYVDTSDEGFPDETLRWKDGSLWRYDPDYEYANWTEVPEGHAIFGVQDIAGEGSIFVVKEKGKVVVDEDGEEYPLSTLYGYHSTRVMKQVSEEEANEPDYSRPMGQMKMYKKGNEEREARFAITGNAERSGMARELGSPLRDVHVNGWRFHPDMSTEIKIEDKKWPKLEKGHYILDYDKTYFGVEKKSTQEIVFVDKNGDVHPTGGDHMSDFFSDDWFEKFKDVNSNIKIYKAEKVNTDTKPATVTRKMTMDPSTKFVRYDDLEREYRRYDAYSRFKNISAYAAAKGYDAIVCNNYGKTIVVLNRTKLVMSDENVKVPV